MSTNTMASPSTPTDDRHGMHMVGEAVGAPDYLTDRQEIEALKAEVAALKASNACLVQSRDWMKVMLTEFCRAATLSSQMFANAAALVGEDEASEEPG